MTHRFTIHTGPVVDLREARERIAELEGLLKAEQDSNHRLSAKELELEAELDRAANEIHRLGMKCSQQEDSMAELEAEKERLREALRNLATDPCLRTQQEACALLQESE